MTAVLAPSCVQLRDCSIRALLLEEGVAAEGQDPEGTPAVHPSAATLHYGTRSASLAGSHDSVRMVSPPLSAADDASAAMHCGCDVDAANAFYVPKGLGFKVWKHGR